jgi:hypothetical protein
VSQVLHAIIILSLRPNTYRTKHLLYSSRMCQNIVHSPHPPHRLAHRSIWHMHLSPVPAQSVYFKLLTSSLHPLWVGGQMALYEAIGKVHGGKIHQPTMAATIIPSPPWCPPPPVPQCRYIDTQPTCPTTIQQIHDVVGPLDTIRERELSMTLSCHIMS